MHFRHDATYTFASIYDLLAVSYLRGPFAVNTRVFPEIDRLIASVNDIEPAWSGVLLSMLFLDSSDLDRLEQHFLERLVIPVPGRHVPPYSSVYLDGVLWGRAAFDVLSWYAQAEITWDNMRPGNSNTRILAPDHVGVELAFLSVMSKNDAAERSLTLTSSQLIDSVLSHLVVWLPRFREQLLRAESGTTDDLALSRWTAFALDVVETDLGRRRRSWRSGETDVAAASGMGS